MICHNVHLWIDPQLTLPMLIGQAWSAIVTFRRLTLRHDIQLLLECMKLKLLGLTFRFQLIYFDKENHFLGLMKLVFFLIAFALFSFVTFIIYWYTTFSQYAQTNCYSPFIFLLFTSLSFMTVFALTHIIHIHPPPPSLCILLYTSTVWSCFHFYPSLPHVYTHTETQAYYLPFSTNQCSPFLRPFICALSL